MRPLYKGDCPTNDAGNNISPVDYKQWRDKLISRIGYYCAYCNLPLSHSLQVEHVIPKNPPPGYTKGDPLTWDNMLLACGPCNNAKSNTPFDTDTYYSPEEHNTYLPFRVVTSPINAEHAIIEEALNLNAYQKNKSLNTIKLFDLNEIDLRDAVVDLRSQKRQKAIIAVNLARQIFVSLKNSPTYNPDLAAEDIARRADASGFFSLWFDAFSDEPLVMRYLTDGNIIKGTAKECFDSNNNFQSVGRNRLNIVDPF